MKTGRTPTARSSITHRLKAVPLILACVLAVVTFFPRQQPAAGLTRRPGQTNIFASGIDAAGNREPEFGPVRFARVGVGQRIFFGISVIDEESDDVRVELTQKPASASYNEKTLTVDWTPRRADIGRAQFAVRITEYPRDSAKQPRTLLKTFGITVEPHPVPTPEVPSAPTAVETLISITDPERLVSANAQWPLLAMFDRIAAIEVGKQIKPGDDVLTTNGAGLFRDALKNLAALHHNEEIDPDSLRFNKQWNAENWRLVMVRPRLNKKVFELRLVYRNVVAAEPVYLMPRMRIVRAKDFFMAQHKEVRLKNNETFARLFHDTFFDGPNLKPFVVHDKRTYGEALASFITKVVTYNDPADPMMQANFAALPHNARLGGDDQRDAKGNYLTGNGWALGVMKVVPVEKQGRRVLGFANLPIDGFATSIKPNGAGDAYVPVPAPRFNPKSPGFVPGWERLVDADDLANVAIADEHDPLAGSIIDASSIARPFKERFMVEETALRDPRRRLFEERGMTCIQCHVRNFDEGDYLDHAVSDPKLGSHSKGTRDIPRLFFVITPDEGRSEFFRRNEEEQVGNLKGVMRDFLKIKVNIDSPLAADWPFDTRRGRS